MAIGTQQQLSPEVLSGADPEAATGDVSFEHQALRRRWKIVARCDGGTAAFTLSGGITAARLATIANVTGVDETGTVFEGDSGPWPSMQLAWSANDGAVTIDAQFWD